MTSRSRTILGGVGLGICSACRAPGAFWYRLFDDFPGVWMCDSCAHPAVVRRRIRADQARRLLHIGFIDA